MINIFILIIDYSILDKIDISHRHARGPGGQHVNKSILLKDKKTKKENESTISCII